MVSPRVRGFHLRTKTSKRDHPLLRGRLKKHGLVGGISEIRRIQMDQKEGREGTSLHREGIRRGLGES